MFNGCRVLVTVIRLVLNFPCGYVHDELGAFVDVAWSLPWALRHAFIVARLTTSAESQTETLPLLDGSAARLVYTGESEFSASAARS